ncbi:hypothetical protein COY89_02560 [Candidatus Roizmanbacteria bacterium CG_4_10_14_0_8_um_filter_36_36]|uniref:Uncharacterized protein n=2 Tax=Candidatus Roizmaniibacteriota TaxID=1752723 RepID=A0A2M8KLB8_9BACT|nr:MAG: hypothetical protein COS51_03350 [Candidatus Roizmanbacteria bacterium CG03_land_8_20_14_0_80_36_21]PIY70202.1 MAG: hypothetical protein COY89_02560 [Candidatus Roizmanbacteria bacterium CG_4_10_14_0_8_um_filter_36_36]PJA53380.1 MAG: hypothetical protein CO166_02190 [Candidatus Roizmanbacteria bacterium CG_4_9_14_3_um_filter_36_11]PJC81357.1 MAG: hypothetical protein CO007_05150 [Candidatus Roizmanbacteria bacterium CG_4_8_14_3_um_filter_36_10]PJE60717.1 MAG: hypothetical protein COU86_
MGIATLELNKSFVPLEGTHFIVTSRPYLKVCELVGITEADIRNKRLLSIGEGLSDFALVCQESGITKSAFAIDPVYDLIRQSGNTNDF